MITLTPLLTEPSIYCMIRTGYTNKTNTTINFFDTFEP